MSQPNVEAPVNEETVSKNALKKAQKEAEKEAKKAQLKAKKKEQAAEGVTNGMANLSTADEKAKAKAKKEENMYNIDLKNAKEGEIVTRFPPEPSGYLHIGHAKAALLNNYFARKYKGKLLLRFDDTNPPLEKQEYQDAILEDLAKLEIQPDRVTYTSDYFEQLYEYCVRMIKSGHAYADDTEQSEMKVQRDEGLPSKNRDMPAEESLAHFEEMKFGSPEGRRWVIRAKISVDSPNKALRDPVIYRCAAIPEGQTEPIPHHRTGSKWKIYPIYHFAVPIVDSLEGVTHALRTLEYHDWNAEYEWTLKVLGLRKVHIWDFARLSLVRTLLSKRKLTKLVDKKVVSGWDDPRFPTVRGILRRGMSVKALHQFMISQGPSKNITLQDWSAIWTMNKKIIDPIAPRYTAIATSNMVQCHVAGVGGKVMFEEKPKHAKNAEVGMKRVYYSNAILIEQEDTCTFAQDEEITLMNWGNAIVRKISKSSDNVVTDMELELHLEGDFKKTEKKITWLSKHQDLVLVELAEFDHLLAKDKLEETDDWEACLTPQTEFKVEAVADCNVSGVKENDIIQFDRKGYFRCDRAGKGGDSPAIFFGVPTGKGEGKVEKK